jgi:hypothetical protein
MGYGELTEQMRRNMRDTHDAHTEARQSPWSLMAQSQSSWMATPAAWSSGWTYDKDTKTMISDMLRYDNYAMRNIAGMYYEPDWTLDEIKERLERLGRGIAAFRKRHTPEN